MTSNHLGNHVFSHVGYVKIGLFYIPMQSCCTELNPFGHRSADRTTTERLIAEKQKGQQFMLC